MKKIILGIILASVFVLSACSGGSQNKAFSASPKNTNGTSASTENTAGKATVSNASKVTSSDKAKNTASNNSSSASSSSAPLKQAEKEKVNSKVMPAINSINDAIKNLQDVKDADLSSLN